MRFLFHACLVAVLALSLNSCGALPSQKFAHSARASIKRIAVIPLGMPEHAQVRIMNPIGAGFGLVGNFVEARRAAGASEEMETILAAAHYDFHASLASAVSRAMSKVGFSLSPAPGGRPDKAHSRFLNAYPPAKAVDAYLDIYAPYVGFEAPRSSSAYRPRLELAVRLVSARDHQILYQDRLVYGCEEDTDEQALLIRADEKLSFRDRAALRAHPLETARALQFAIETTAWELAKQFK
jgi:hypothetical protein